MDKESIKIINEAIALQLRKSDDYQNKESWIKQADYYPRGVLSILDIVYAKVLRMYSVVEAMEKDPNYEQNFESIEDSCKDLINYASFIGAYARGGIEGQKPNKDFLNREKVKKNYMSEDHYDTKEPKQSLYDLKSEYID